MLSLPFLKGKTSQVSDVWLFIAVTCFSALAFSILSIPFDFSGAIPILACAVSTAIAVYVVRRHLMTGLARRLVDEAKTSVEWDVSLNGVKIGTIHDAEYTRICLREFRQAHNYVAQFLNLSKVFLRFIISGLFAIPVVLFWLVVMVLHSPESLAPLAAGIQHGEPAVVTHAAKYFLELLRLSICLGFLVAFTLTLTAWNLFKLFGYVNCFAEAINVSIRRRFGVAADGAFILSRIVTNESDPDKLDIVYTDYTDGLNQKKTSRLGLGRTG